MSLFDLLDHLLNFVAPALFMALVLPLAARLFTRKKPVALVLWRQCAIQFIAGVAVLAAGLVYFGADGRMATYAALVVVAGTVQWVMGRG